MRRKAKQKGSGGRLRLGLLLATAAAFLLVPAAQAMAANDLDLNITAESGASGEVSSDESKTFTSFEGSPSIECNYPVGGPQEGTCENVMHEIVIPFNAWVVTMKAIPGPESFEGEWEVIGGEAFGGTCEPGAAVCTVKTEVKDEDIEVNFRFEKEGPYLDLSIVGEEGGGGEVVSPGSIYPPNTAGTPPLACNLPEGGVQEGVCENEMFYEEGPGLWTVSMVAIPAPNSEFVKWESPPPGFAFCPAGDTTSSNCQGVSTTGADIEMIAKFKCEAGKTCPPPLHPLQLIKTGNGDGTVTSSPAGINCAPGCTEDEGSFEEGETVTLTASAGTGSEFTGWTGADAEAAGCDETGATLTCEVEMTSPLEVEAGFDLETFAFSTTVNGEGTVKCNGVPCAASYDYGTEVEVTAEPISIEYLLEDISGTGDAAGCTESPCEFTITQESSVTAEFKTAAFKSEAKVETVHGEVPETTTLEAEGCEDVDLGLFIPGVTDDYTNTCPLTLTSTGAATQLTAEDESATNTGHLVQGSYFLPSLLKARAEDSEAKGTSAGLVDMNEAPGAVTLMTFAEPIAKDASTLEFSQHIDENDGLHTGVYSKTITLTLEQTTP